MKLYEHFSLSKLDNILICNFQNRKFGNSFSKSCAIELEKLLKIAIKEKISGLIMTSEDRIFCSGGNLKDYAKLSKKTQGLQINKYITKVLNQFDQTPFPTVLALQGDCFGGGLEWASAFDKIFSSPNSLLGMWQTKIALSWGWGGGKRLQKRVGKKALQNILLEGKTFSAYDGLKLGFVDAIYPEHLLMDYALKHLKSQKKLPKIPFPSIKKDGLEKEDKVFSSLWMNSEHIKILKSFGS